MERKRIRLENTCEEDEDLDRRTSPRSKKKVNYRSIEDDEEQDGEEDQEGMEDQEDNEQPGTSTQNINNQGAQENRLLPVTCGNKKGILHVEKLDGAEECIDCEGRWFTPRAFEVFGGKAANKKWKHSISYQNKPLTFWFKNGFLTTNGLKRRGTKSQKQKKILPQDHTSDSETPLEEIQSAEETEDDDVEDEDWLPGNIELAQETEEEMEERVGTDNGEDSAVNEGLEEEDKIEKREQEKEAAVVDNNKGNSVFEERVTELIVSAPEKIALQKEVIIILERVPELQATRDCQSNDIEHPLEDLTPEVLNETKDTGLTSNHTANLRPSAVPLAAQGTGHFRDVTTSDYDATQLQVMEPETRFPQTSDSTRPSDMTEGPISTFSNLDTMNPDQLKREKIKMQLKVLKLQHEYYTLGIKKLKNEIVSSEPNCMELTLDSLSYQ